MNTSATSLWVLIASFGILICPANIWAQKNKSTLVLSIDMNTPVREGWFDPESEVVGIRGDAPPTSWGNTTPAKDHDGDGIYELELVYSLEEDSLLLSFKVKVDGKDNPNDGWQEGLNHTQMLRKNQSSQLSMAWEDQAAFPPATFTGNVQVVEGFNSGSLAERDIFIYLPPGYEEGDQRYPVLYMHDGQFLFDAAYAGEEWGMDEVAEELIRSGKIEPLIIVGIGNTSDRAEEYTPTRQFWHYAFTRTAPPTGGKLNQLTGTFTTGGGETLRFKAAHDSLYAMVPGSDFWQALIPQGRSEYFLPRAGITFQFHTRGKDPVQEVTASKPPMGGQGKAYGEFILNTLKPTVDSELRTQPGPEHTGMAGASFGGLITMHLGMHHPEVFGMLYPLSPSVWWDQRVLLKQVEELPGPTTQPVWLYIGTGEGEETVRNTRDLRDALLDKGWDASSITYTETPDAAHNMAAWRKTLKPILLDFSKRVSGSE